MVRQHPDPTPRLSPVIRSRNRFASVRVKGPAHTVPALANRAKRREPSYCTHGKAMLLLLEHARPTSQPRSTHALIWRSVKEFCPCHPSHALFERGLPIGHIHAAGSASAGRSAAAASARAERYGRTHEALHRRKACVKGLRTFSFECVARSYCATSRCPLENHGKETGIRALKDFYVRMDHLPGRPSERAHRGKRLGTFCCSRRTPLHAELGKPLACFRVTAAGIGQPRRKPPPLQQTPSAAYVLRTLVSGDGSERAGGQVDCSSGSADWQRWRRQAEQGRDEGIPDPPRGGRKSEESAETLRGGAHTCERPTCQLPRANVAG